MLRIHHFCLWLRLQVAKVPELTPAPAPTYLGQLRLLAKKAAPGGSGSGCIH